MSPQTGPTRHPSDGVLRRLVDEPVGVSDPDRAHVAACARCTAALEEARADAAALGAVLAPAGQAGSAFDDDGAWARLRSAAARETGTHPRVAHLARLTSERSSTRRARSGRVRRALRRPGVVALGVAVVVAGAGTAAASDWLRIFQVQEVAPLSLSSADLAGLGQLPDPSAFGEAVATDPVDVHPVADAAAAASETGLDVPQLPPGVQLPRGVTGDPTYQVGDAGTVSFTFSAARAAESAQQAGAALPPVPEGLDGSVVRLQAGPGVAVTWASQQGVPALVVGRAVAPTASSTGVPFDQVRDYLLSLPGVPADLASQLETFSGDGSTLPLPVPADRANSSTADVDGATATVVTSNDGAVSGVVWVSDGVVTAVAGSLDADELLDVARALR